MGCVTGHIRGPHPISAPVPLMQGFCMRSYLIFQLCATCNLLVYSHVNRMIPGPDNELYDIIEKRKRFEDFTISD